MDPKSECSASPQGNGIGSLKQAAKPCDVVKIFENPKNYSIIHFFTVSMCFKMKNIAKSGELLKSYNISKKMYQKTDKGGEMKWLKNII